MERGFDHSREPLLPSRSSSLNTRSVAGHEQKRRKISLSDDDSTRCTWNFDAVTLSPSQKSFTFVPVSTILRAHLPLSWLATSVSTSPQPGDILKANITGISRWDYHVLIARQASCQTLFAFEKVDIDAYICYPLQSWVKLQWIDQAAIGAAPVVNLEVMLKHQGEHTRSRKASVSSAVGAVNPSPVVASPKIPQNRRGQLARLSILDPREKTEELSCTLHGEEQEVISHVELISVCADTEHDVFDSLNDVKSKEGFSVAHSCSLPQGDESSLPTLSSLISLSEPSRAVDPLSAEHLRRQYLETLYLSKTSLAFFAKGPLSRARARARAPNASRDPQGLVDFYTESVLAIKKLDIKYKDSIQGKVTDLKADEHDVQSESNPNSRKSKRTKLGKDGLWPLEDEYIRRWWKSQEFACQAVLTTASFSTETRQLIAQLRMRETEMQILLILEILALEARDIPTQLSTSEPSKPNLKVESVEGGEAGVLPKVSQLKKRRDLSSELDLLVDRLCIWHSVGFEDADTSQLKMQASGSSSSKLKDRLRDFCKDVIVPFYSGKVPDECRVICAKMGGPEVSTRCSNKGREKEAVEAVPGSAITHRRPAKKRDFERILSEDPSVRQGSPPSLSRSATLPMAVNSMREPSERPISRSGLQKSVSFSNREVDLVVDARATATKRRKIELVAAQKRELDAAIETLKRPNRSVVAKSFMDDADRRSADNKSAARKVEPIQITATPQKNRIRRIDSSDYDLPTMAAFSAHREDTCVPSSTGKPRGLSQLLSSVPRSSAKRRAVLSAIHDTPSRATTNPTHTFLVDAALPESDNGTNGVSSSTLVASTPAASRLRLDLCSANITLTPMRMSKSLKPVLLTPMEKSEVDIESAFKDATEVPERAGKMMDRVMGSRVDSAEMSLYQSLGWDDDYDL